MGSASDWLAGSSVLADPTHVVTLRNQEIERIGGEVFESTGPLLMFGKGKVSGTFCDTLIWKTRIVEEQ